MNAEIYSIIQDEDAFKDFIQWLPECSEIEQYYVTLFSRKKYFSDPAVQYDKTQLKRFTSTKDRLFYKVRQLECRIGSYRGDKDLPIPQEALALYMSPNPRDLKRSIIKGIKVFADLLDDPNKYPNPRQEIMSVIQTTKNKTHYHVFDIDSKDPAHLEKAMNVVRGFCVVIETRGGYHLLVSQADVDAGYFQGMNWYAKLKELADVTGDALIPVVGCYQGGFVPKFKYFNNQFLY